MSSTYSTTFQYSETPPRPVVASNTNIFPSAGRSFGRMIQNGLQSRRDDDSAHRMSARGPRGRLQRRPHAAIANASALDAASASSRTAAATCADASRACPSASTRAGENAGSASPCSKTIRSSQTSGNDDTRRHLPVRASTTSNISSGLFPKKRQLACPRR